MNTKFCKVTAIFSSLDLKKVEDALIAAGFSGMTVSKTHESVSTIYSDRQRIFLPKRSIAGHGLRNISDPNSLWHEG